MFPLILIRVVDGARSGESNFEISPRFIYFHKSMMMSPIDSAWAVGIEVSAVITKNVVAMGYPSEKLEGVFRNKLTDVKRCVGAP